jgi:hypothetical protein
LVLTLTANEANVSGSLERPQQFSSTNNIFANISNVIRTDKIVESHFANGTLHLTTQNANNAKDTDTFVMTVNADHAELSYDLPPDIVLPPFQLQRMHPGEKVATDWAPNRAYSVSDSDIPNAEMKAIFDEDQRVRQSTQIDWKTVSRSDADRRGATKKLLSTGSLHTGKDFEEAAFVFQHGDSASDYLLAHTLAMVAVAKGNVTSIWIASATLDRYLQKIGQKQIYGTQYLSNAKKEWTQEPYDRELVSDALRQQLGVPVQSDQAKQLKVYQNQK